MLGVLVFRVYTIWQDTWRKASGKKSGKAKIANLDLATVAIDVDFITAEVAMNNGRALVVQVAQALQDLLAPLLDCFQLKMLVL